MGYLYFWGEIQVGLICDVKLGPSQYEGQSFHDVLSMLSSGILTFNALASDSHQNQWTDLLQYRDFPKYLVEKLMLASNGYSYDSLFNHWYVKDGEGRFGPFSLVQMLEFYHQNRIHMDSLISHPSSQGWEPFSKTGPFELRSLEKLVSCSPILKLISRRRHPRIQYDNEVFISAAAELYRGVTWSLSARGLGLVTDNPTLMEPGHRVNLIINSNNDHGAVQLKGQVVNLRKELNYERVAIEFDGEHESINHYISQRVPRL